jgi:hypothetical protein
MMVVASVRIRAMSWEQFEYECPRPTRPESPSQEITARDLQPLKVG